MSTILDFITIKTIRYVRSSVLHIQFLSTTKFSVTWCLVMMCTCYLYRKMAQPVPCATSWSTEATSKWSTYYHHKVAAHIFQNEDALWSSEWMNFSVYGLADFDIAVLCNLPNSSEIKQTTFAMHVIMNISLHAGIIIKASNWLPLWLTKYNIYMLQI